MRLWSIHPAYLDTKGLVAVWREGLLAQAVLAGRTKGYRHHPQLTRFKKLKNPLRGISTYLHVICDEADRRNYRFSRERIIQSRMNGLRISVTSGQLLYEVEHLKRKLKQRGDRTSRASLNSSKIQPHPLFRRRPGVLEKWEILEVV